MSAKVTKHITFPTPLAEKIMKSASIYGVSFGEYLRHLAMQDKNPDLKIEEQKRKEWEDSLPVYEATEEKWEEWDKVRKGKKIKMTAAEASAYIKNMK